ncbi:hypothetical protein TIFTF001_020777 [Ficus carica]|uniref:Uncharacterized protein n=1 Tax=Ficus carica TaxID=3494 RepID=A0AA88DA51_FICCA|nr:hypothetical protein TIFTF001_020777 [Ficus carica]
MVRVAREGVYLAVKPKLAVDERTALPPPPVPDLCASLCLSIIAENLGESGQRESFSCGEAGSRRRRTNGPPPLPHYRYLCTFLSLNFCQKELPIVSAIVDHKRNLPFATAMRSSSLPSSPYLSSSTAKREILSPGYTTSPFELCRARLQVVPPYGPVAVHETFPTYI